MPKYLCVFFVLLGLSPKLTFIISAMPNAIIGAILLYMASHMICTGISMISNYLLDTQQILIIGVSILCAIGIPDLPMVKDNSNIFIQSVMNSSIAIGCSLTIILTFIFFVFTAKSKRLSLALEKHTDFIKNCHIFLTLSAIAGTCGKISISEFNR